MAACDRSSVEFRGAPQVEAQVRRHYGTVPLLVTVDLCALLLGVALVGRWSWASLAYAGASLLVFVGSHEYRHRLSYQLVDGLPRLFSRLAMPLFALGFVGVFLDVPERVLLQAPVSGALLVAGRAAAYALIRRRRRNGRRLEATLIIGAGRIGAELSRLLEEHPEYGLCPVGIVDDLPNGVGEPHLAVPLLGPTADLPRLLAEHAVAHVIVAFSPIREEDLVQVLRMVINEEVAVYVVPRFFEVGLNATSAQVDSVWGIPLYHLRHGSLHDSTPPGKRVFDIVIAGAALMALAPLLVVIAAAVRLTSSGPLLFKQRRVGQHGQSFSIVKFRTMTVNEDSDITWSVRDDDRRTSVGRLLRPLSLDELPQLWNVLRGEMSLVGPRPERPYFVDKFQPSIRGYSDRHRLPVGLTGLAQVKGLRGDTSIEQRVRFDNYYIEHWSPWQDMVILFSTVGEIFRSARVELLQRSLSGRPGSQSLEPPAARPEFPHSAGKDPPKAPGLRSQNRRTGRAGPGVAGESLT